MMIEKKEGCSIMFRCSVTKKVSREGEQPITVVLERRHRDYWNTPDGRAPEPGDMREWSVVSTGWEVVKEVMVSRAGATILQQRMESEAAFEPTRGRSAG